MRNIRGARKDGRCPVGKEGRLHGHQKPVNGIYRNTRDRLSIRRGIRLLFRCETGSLDVKQGNVAIRL